MAINRQFTSLAQNSLIQQFLKSQTWIQLGLIYKQESFVFIDYSAHFGIQVTKQEQFLAISKQFEIKSIYGRNILVTL